MIQPLCPRCGAVAVNSINVWGAAIVGCPCVGERPTMVPSTFAVSRRQVYRSMANQPEVQIMAKWGERLYAAKYADHDPGDEERR